MILNRREGEDHGPALTRENVERWTRICRAKWVRDHGYNPWSDEVVQGAAPEVEQDEVA